MAVGIGEARAAAQNVPNEQPRAAAYSFCEKVTLALGCAAGAAIAVALAAVSAVATLFFSALAGMGVIISAAAYLSLRVCHSKEWANRAFKTGVEISSLPMVFMLMAAAAAFCLSIELAVKACQPARPGPFGYFNSRGSLFPQIGFQMGAGEAAQEAPPPNAQVLFDRFGIRLEHAPATGPQ